MLQQLKNAYFCSMQTLLEAFTAYATEHSDKEPQLLAQLRRETHQKVLQPRMLSGPLQGRLLSLLAQMTVPKRILEVGTFTGYATLCLAEGLPPEGVIDTIDCNEEIVAFQNSFFEKSPYRKQIHQHLGDAKVLIPQLEQQYDLVFLDADKRYYPEYFEMILPKLNTNGLLIADNVLWSGKVLYRIDAHDADTKALHQFNQMMAEDKRLTTVFLPLRDGLSIGRKR